MRLMGLEAVYPKPHLSAGGTGHKVYPYLLRNVAIERANQVWSTDITYIPMPNGFMYLTAVIDWYSRYVLSWKLSNTLDMEFCLRLGGGVERGGCPEVFNTDQGVQFTSASFTGRLEVGRRQGEHGRQGSLPGQRVRGAVVADGEVRVRLPMASGGGAGVGDGVDDLLRVLQRRADAPVAGGSHAGRGLREGIEITQGMPCVLGGMAPVTTAGEEKTPQAWLDPRSQVPGGTPSAELSLGWMLASRANLRFTRRS